MRRLSRVDAMLSLMVLIWGANYAVVKAALLQMRPLAFNAFRFTLASLLLLGLLHWRQGGIRVMRKDLGRLILLALIGNTAYQLLFINGFSLTRAIDTTLILAVTPIVTLAFSFLLRTEKIHPYSGAGAALSFFGVVLVVTESARHASSYAPDPVLGNLLLCGSVFCWSIYTVASVSLVRRYGSLHFTALTMSIGTLFLLPLSIPSLANQNWSEVSVAAWMGVIFSACGSLVFGYFAWYYGVHRIGAARTSIYSNLTPPIAIACAWLFLDEPLAWGQLVGMAVILSGIALTRKAPHPDTPETGA